MQMQGCVILVTLSLLQLVQRIPDGQTLPPLVVETENDSDKAKDLAEKGRGHQSHALQHWYRHMTERRRQQDFISRESVCPISRYRVQNVFLVCQKLMCIH